MVDCSQTSLIQGGLCHVVIVRKGEVSIIRGWRDLREAVVDRVS